MSIFNKIFKSYSEKEVKRIMPIVDKINSLEDEISKLTDEELKNKTNEFKEQLDNGKTLDDILPEAFAVVREASKRVLGMRHFDVQLIGGIILHQGRIAEMKTGEGKTLVATLPVYLNALTGRGVHVITVNDYLAKRDSEWMGKLYKFMGLSVGLVIAGMDPKAKQKAYACDITYGTNNEFGFDYLRDNMVIYKEQLVQRDLAYAIVDEIDSILIDEARTPLIISGRANQSSDLYKKANDFVKRLTPKVIVEEDVKDEAQAEDNENYDYIVVNDCSKDNTKEICEKNNFNMLSLPINYGLTSGIQIGMKYAYKNNYDIAIQFDGDGQHQAKYLKDLVKEIEDGNVNIVIGSRFVKEKKPFTARMLGSRIIAFFTKITTGKTIKDTTSGMRAYDKNAIKEFVTNTSLTPEPDTMVYMLKKGLKIKEVQVEMKEREFGKSYLTPIKSMKL